jgi:hypothetical protein
VSTGNGWAELRQVVLATLDHEAAVRAATELLELGPGVRFVPAAGGRTGIVAVDLHAADREHGPGLEGGLCRTLIRFV